MKIKAERLRQDIEKIAEFTSTDQGGTTRLSFTKEHERARDYIALQMEEAGLTVSQDAIGNLIGRREGTEPEFASVMTGSHFDTVCCGGNFDGVAGVVAGLEAARVMNEQNIHTKRPLEFIAMVGEEGARFGAAYLGSRAMMGLLSEEELRSLCDADGISIWDAMQQFGLNPAKIADAVRKPDEIYAFVEMHIEQGPVLEQSDTKLGIVECIVANRTLEITIQGQANHAGTTPMHMRLDAFAASARLAQLAMDKAIELGDGTVATMGQMSVYPGSTNVIPGKVVFTLDIRSKEDSNLDQIEEVLQAAITHMIKERQIVAGCMQNLPGSCAVFLNEHIIAELEKSAEALQCSNRRMVSGAGHDAMILAQFIPTGMLFVPSKNGCSHCPEEWTEYEQLQQGCEVLLETLIRLGNEI